MKVGFVFECQPQGSDEQVYTYVAKKLCDKFEILPENISSLGDKKTVLQESAIDVKIMLDNGCRFVFVIWDRMPKWGGTGKCSDHKSEITKNLTTEKVDLSKVVLCCIDEMLESWLISDGRGVTNYFKEINHLSTEFPDHKKKTEQTSPKERIKKYNGRYNESVDNIGIVKALPDFTRIEKRNDSFAEFASAVKEICKQ
jgi:hypothetical protein